MFINVTLKVKESHCIKQINKQFDAMSTFHHTLLNERVKIYGLKYMVKYMDTPLYIHPYIYGQQMRITAHEKHPKDKILQNEAVNAGAWLRNH